jgi:hypothetical protein
VAFETWRSLAHQGLNDTEAAKLIIALISTAARDARDLRFAAQARKRH